ncbi:MAG: hypothetical protein Q8T11_11510 [Elusimicrobiota bacterium]|nr:hypothetical protein [Elusimicrobiota bacterium]
MIPLTRKTLDIADLDLSGGRTRRPEEPFDKQLTDSFNEVQPELFRGNSRSSVEAGIVDPDVEDTIGGE